MTLQAKWCMDETQLPCLTPSPDQVSSTVDCLLLAPLLQLAESFADGMGRRNG